MEDEKRIDKRRTTTKSIDRIFNRGTVSKSSRTTDEIFKRARTLPDLKITLAFDTTSSMTPYIETVRNNLVTLTSELLEEEKNIAIMVCGVGEYLDAPYTLQMNPYTKDTEELSNAIRSIRSTYGGGACQVSLELLFKELSDRYIKGKNNLVVIISDQIAHGQDGKEKNPRAGYRYELERLKENLTGFYFVGCSDDSAIINLQKNLVNVENPNEGFIKLDEMMILTELLVAISKKTVSEDRLIDYLYRLETSPEASQRLAGRKIRGYLPPSSK